MLDRIGDDLLDISKRVLELTPLRNKTIKIAITGLSRSGKSVFITSLIDCLINSKNILNKKSSFQVTLQAPKLSMKRFDYYHFSKQIKQEHIWCDSTSSISLALLKVRVKGSIPFLGDEDFYIELIDYPGEWLLDLTLFSHTFTSWSNQTIQWLQKIDDSKAKEYLAFIETINTKDTSIALETSLHVKYVELIKHLKKLHYSFLTPGRFLVPADMKDDPILLFAPIFKTNSTLYKNYEKRFKTYVNDIVKGIHLDYFRGFDRQIMLVDVIAALQNGYTCYEDMSYALKSMLSVYSHAKGNFISRVINPSIENVVFVGTKADLVPSSSHNNYLSLLKDMTLPLKDKLESIDIKTSSHIVASVKCTQTIMSEKNGIKLPSLRGIDRKSGKIVEVYPGAMPSSFPPASNWDKSLYMYEEFNPPKKEYGADEPFENIHIDKLILEIIGDML